ncbi:MAG: hypothetical protein DRI46_11330, partial [Chloroflexi bacterium]
MSASSKIKSIKRVSSSSKRYDLEVQNNHNFYANGMLVHNCTSMYKDHIHARSMDSGYHQSRTWVQALHANVRYKLRDNQRICGENMF